MIWALEWGPVVYRDVKQLPLHSAAELCAAVMRFAETGRGPVLQASLHNPRQLKLIVPGAVALLNADPRSNILLVTRMFRRQ